MENKSPKTKFQENRQQFIDDIIKNLEKGTVPWQKEWTTGSTPYNPVTNNRYKGGNSLRLTFVSLQNKYTDPRWVTFKQAQDKEWTIKKGSKGVPIEIFKLYDKHTKKDFKAETIKDLTDNQKEEYLKKNVKLVCKNYYVFNASQIEGIPPLKKEQEKAVEYDKLKLIEKNCGVPITHFGDQAFYSPGSDTITMPPKENFKNENSYYATLLHEISHSTGHKTRLNRNIQNSFGSEDYAREELVAELSSVFIGQEKGLQYNYENNKAYINSWIKILKNDPNELFKAATQAEKATEYVLGYEKGITKDKTIEQSKGIEI